MLNVIPLRKETSKPVKHRLEKVCDCCFEAEQQADLFPYKEGKVCFMQKKRKMTLERRHNLTGWAFLSIGVVLICWTSFYPMIQAFILSLKSGLGVNLKFNGFFKLSHES